MQDWRSSLVGFLDHAWQEISDFQTSRNGTPGLISLASVNPSGEPECRTVVLRSANRERGVVDTFSDNLACKTAEIRQNPNVTALIWQPTTGLQIRLRGHAEVFDGQDIRALWGDMPARGRKNYGVTPAPGSEIPRSDAFQRKPDPTRLAHLVITVNEIDVVYLGPPNDIRARFCRNDDWAGRWLAP